MIFSRTQGKQMSGHWPGVATRRMRDGTIVRTSGEPPNRWRRKHRGENSVQAHRKAMRKAVNLHHGAGPREQSRINNYLQEVRAAWNKASSSDHLST